MHNIFTINAQYMYNTCTIYAQYMNNIRTPSKNNFLFLSHPNSCHIKFLHTRQLQRAAVHGTTNSSVK